jgi:multidrug efflux pump
VVTPSLLALRVWIEAGAFRSAQILRGLSFGRDSDAARDNALRRAAAKVKAPEILWETGTGTEPEPDAPELPLGDGKLRAAE